MTLAPVRSVRYVNLTRPTLRLSSMTSNVNETSLELDSHADTCCIGSCSLILNDYDRPVTVYGYDPGLGSQTFRTVSAVIGYTHPQTGAIYHLVVHQAIEIPHLDHHLLCPMQCRVNDVTINEVPKFLTPDPTPSTHALVCDMPDTTDDELTLPLCLRGVTSYLPVHKPSRDDWNAHIYPRIELTSEHLEWDPASTRYTEMEEALTDINGEVGGRSSYPGDPPLVINSIMSLNSPLTDITNRDTFASVLKNKVRISAVHTGHVRAKSGKSVDAQVLSQRWLISPDRAKTTVRKTTQRGVRNIMNPSMSRRYPTNDRMLRYPRLNHPLFSDTLIAGTKSKRGNKNAQVYGSSFGWCRAFPMATKGDAHDTLPLLFKRDGVPPDMIMDNSKEQLSKAFRKKLREADCHLKTIEPYSPWMNAAEMNIRELKRGSSRKMIKTQSPKRLWDHCLELEARIRSCTAHDNFSLDGEVPETVMTGHTADISSICEFEWYQWVMYNDATWSFPDPKWVLGRYLGPAIDVGSAMTAKILRITGECVPRSTLRPLTLEESKSEVMTDLRRKFDEAVAIKLGQSATEADFPVEDLTPVYDQYLPDDGIEGTADEPDLEPTPELGDNYLNADVMLPLGDSLARGRVIARKRDSDGTPIGRANDNPILDSRQYAVEFDDGQVTELTANVIAESMYAMCDENGHKVNLFNCITDNRRSEKSLSLADQKFSDSRGKTQYRRTTKGWDLCIEWKDGSTSWEKLHDFKECYPVQTAEYAVAQGIDHEPAFNWWVKHTLKKRDRIISLVDRRQTKFVKKNQKFGIDMPRNIKHALEIDRQNGNTLWADAIAKEMKNVRIAFDILPNGESAPNGYKQIRCHMIFDIKIEDFRRKARLVAGGHMTDAPKCMTYSSVVSRESVRLALTIAALNDLEVKSGDIMNAYITAPITEKVWTVLGPMFGRDAGKKAIIVRALYGLKSAGAAFRKHLADCMRHIGYVSCLADPDLWMKPEVDADGDKYYSYILCYVDDVLIADHDAMKVMNKIDKYFQLKPESVGDPDMYLGAKLRCHETANGVMAWTLSPSKYVREAVNNCVTHLKENYGGRYSLLKQAPNPFTMSYDPDTDVTEPLDPERANYFQSIIGVMRWMIEIGRIDIATEVSMLSSYLAYPREGHFEAALHIMSYLKAKHNSRLFLDPTYPDIDHSTFNDGADWKEFYGDVTEALPPNAPLPRGKEVDIRMMVDSDHAGDKSTRRSRTGYLIYVNMALIIWSSKKQPTIESSVFGAEFVAMKTGMEDLRGLRYKLRMMGVPVTGPSYVYGDNMSVIYNTSKPESTLKKKNNSICYHALRESVAMGETLTTHIPTEWNLSDLLTKVLYGQKRKNMVEGILYDVYDYN